MNLTTEQRATGIGGTDMVAICGESPYRSAIDVYAEKRRGLGYDLDEEAPPAFEGNERTEWGNILEPLLADRYHADTGLLLVEPNSFRHPERPWQTGTPDRLAYGPEDQPGDGIDLIDAATGEAIVINRPRKIWEGKSHGLHGGKGYDLAAMEVPDDKKIQVHWYAALVGCRSIDLSALIDTHIYRVFHVEHDQQVEDFLLEEGESFWKRITEGRPPEPDGSESFTRYLRHRFAKHATDMIEATPETIEAIESLRALREHKKKCEAKIDKLAQEIKIAVGHHMGAIGPDGKPLVTWKRRERGSVSYSKALADLRDRCGVADEVFEQILDAHTGEPPRVFTVK